MFIFKTNNLLCLTTHYTVLKVRLWCLWAVGQVFCYQFSSTEHWLEMERNTHLNVLLLLFQLIQVSIEWRILNVGGVACQNQLSGFCFVHSLDLFCCRNCPLPSPPTKMVWHILMHKLLNEHLCICIVFNIAKVLWEIKITKLEKIKLLKNRTGFFFPGCVHLLLVCFSVIELGRSSCDFCGWEEGILFVAESQ